jgi:hypothetical protein
VGVLEAAAAAARLRKELEAVVVGVGVRGVTTAAVHIVVGWGRGSGTVLRWGKARGGWLIVEVLVVVGLGFV